MPTGYVYDPVFLEHDLRGHPENRDRLFSAMRFLREQHLVEQMEPILAPPVQPETLELNHTHAYIDAVADISASGGGHLDMDTYVAPKTYEAALRAAGGVVAATEAVMRGELDNAVCLVRPPGHHAVRTRGMGFCIFNNIAVAAHAVRAQGMARRILIVDFDVHHGNGTQASFYNDPNVLYCSTHQYPHYPGTGSLNEIGEGAGRGFTINVPLPADAGDTGFERVFEEILCPAGKRFAPDLLLVSAGFDTHWADPLASLALSLTGFAWICRRLVRMSKELCGGRIVFALEGGYHLHVLSQGVHNMCCATLGLPEQDDIDLLGPSPHPEPSLDALIRALRQVHGL